MNCVDWEERISLYAGGDLGDLPRLEVEKHLAECAGCQVFASGLKQSLEWARQVHSEEPAPAHYAAVRARVISQLRSRRRRVWTWSAAALAAAAFAVLVAARLSIPQGAVPPPPQVALAHPPAPELAARPQPSSRRPVSVPAQAAARPRRRILAPSEPLVVKLVTDNPDVVIYWIVDTKVVDTKGE